MTGFSSLLRRDDSPAAILILFADHGPDRGQLGGPLKTVFDDVGVHSVSFPRFGGQPWGG
jgi:hypothetical protein